MAVANGLICTAGNLDGKTVITALDLDGKSQWTFTCGQPWTGSHPGTRSTPTIDGDHLYYESPLGDVVCLELKSGKEIWRLNLLEKFGAKNIRWALAESPVIDGDHLICTPGGPDTRRGGARQADRQSGLEVGQRSRRCGRLCHPGSDRIPGTTNRSDVDRQGLDRCQCPERRSPVPLRTRDQLRRQPVADAHLPRRTDLHQLGYGAGSEMLKLTIDGKKASVKQLWTSKDLDNHHGGVLLVDGYLYGSCFKPKWACLDWKTGKTCYSDSGVGKGSLTYAEGFLYTLSEKSQDGPGPGQFRRPQGRFRVRTAQGRRRPQAGPIRSSAAAASTSATEISSTRTTSRRKNSPAPTRDQKKSHLNPATTPVTIQFVAGLTLAAPQFIPSTAEDRPDAVLGHADGRADLLIALPFQMEHPHHEGLGPLQSAQQAFDLFLVADALLRVRMRIRNRLGRLLHEPPRRTSREHFTHNDPSSDNRQIGCQTALTAEVSQEARSLGLMIVKNTSAHRSSRSSGASRTLRAWAVCRTT